MRASIVATALLLVLCTACGDDASGPGDEVVIQMLDNSFSQATQQVGIGTTVRWRNNGQNPHNSTRTATPESWSSGTVQPGGSFTRTFNSPGTFAYECTIHPGMNGTLTVQ